MNASSLVRKWEATQRAREPVRGGYGDKKEEHALFEELLSRYLEFPNEGRSSDKALWEPCNNIIDKYISRGMDYSRFKIVPLWEDRTGFIPHHYIQVTSSKSQIHAALKRIASDYGFLDPTHQIREYKKEGVMTITNNNHNEQSQEATQTNNQTANIGINISQLEEALSETLSGAQLAQIKPAIDQFSHEPKKWMNAENLIKAALALGKEATMIVLRVVLTKYLPLP